MDMKTTYKCDFDSYESSASSSSSSSDCRSTVTGSRNFDQRRKTRVSKMFSSSSSDNDKMIQLSENEKVYSIIKQRFTSCLDDSDKIPKIVAIHKRNWNSASCILGRAKVQNFQIHSQAVAKKCGNGNVKYAWFGSTEEGVSRIMNYGFGIDDIQQYDMFGKGVYLYPDHCPIDSVKTAVEDENGLKHVILGRVILGNQELVHPYSNQSCPSSENFDTGIDDFHSPSKYIVWSMNMNTHILPEYVISLRAPARLNLKSSSEEEGVQDSHPLMLNAEKKFPTSPWMPFTALIPLLAKFLPPRSINLIQKSYKDHKERKMSRNELVQRVRKIAGDELLVAAIKSYRTNKISGYN